MRCGILVTGTDTGVGKTVVAAGLVVALRRAGIDANGAKPVETGLDSALPSDSELLARATRTPLPARPSLRKGSSSESPPSSPRVPRERQLPVPLLRLREALTPAFAAERAGVPLRATDLTRAVRRWQAEAELLVVEGAGGLLAPLAWTPRGAFSALDLARRCALDAILVARAGLGTLNHVLLTAAALAHRRVTLRLVVLNGRSRRPDLAERTNPTVLARLLPTVPILVLPRQEDVDPWSVARASARKLGHALSLTPSSG